MNGPPGTPFSQCGVGERAEVGNIGAAGAGAGEVLKQPLSLHRRAKALHRELYLAELALGNDSGEANLDRLKDIQAQLSAPGGIEAAVEGFGAQSGRPSGTL